MRTSLSHQPARWCYSASSFIRHCPITSPKRRLSSRLCSEIWWQRTSSLATQASNQFHITLARLAAVITASNRLKSGLSLGRPSRSLLGSSQGSLKSWKERSFSRIGAREMFRLRLWCSSLCQMCTNETRLMSDKLLRSCTKPPQLNCRSITRLKRRSYSTSRFNTRKTKLCIKQRRTQRLRKARKVAKIRLDRSKQHKTCWSLNRSHWKTNRSRSARASQRLFTLTSCHLSWASTSATSSWRMKM